MISDLELLENTFPEPFLFSALCHDTQLLRSLAHYIVILLACYYKYSDETLSLFIIKYFCVHMKLGVALVLCNSDPVLNDGLSGSDSSSKAVIDGVRRIFLEKVVKAHEDDDDGFSSD